MSPPRYRKYSDRLPDYIKHYDGPLRKKLMSAKIFRIYRKWSYICHRCFNPKDASYIFYGAKGIKVLFNSRDFIGWWLYWIDRIDFDPSLAVVSRIDHSKDYCFSNIKLESNSDNSKECAYRTVSNRMAKVHRPVAAICKTTGRILKEFKSLKDASAYSGVDASIIVKICAGISGTRKVSYTFKRLPLTR